MLANVYKKAYSPGNVSVYARAGRKPKWRANIKEGTTTDVLDDCGLTVMVNGKPKTRTTWRAISRTLDAPCAKSGSGYSGKRAATAELAEWRAQLEAEAEEEYQKAMAEPEIPEVPEFKYVDTSISDFLDTYFVEKELDGLEPSTLVYDRKHAKCIKAFFGDTPIGKLDADGVNGFNRWMVSRELSPVTRSKRLKMLRRAWRAHKKEIGTDDPFDGFKFPASENISPNPLDERSLDDLLLYLEDAEPSQFNTAVELALRTGARRGEVCALKWKDVDLTTGKIHIRAAVAYGKNGCEYYLKPPKSKNGVINNRKVPGNEGMVKILTRRYDEMAREIKAKVGDLSDSELNGIMRELFVCGDTSGDFLNPEHLTKWWKGFSIRYKGTQERQPVFHDLRHTYATMAIASGIDPVTVAKILGHTDPRITMRTYADALGEVTQAAQDTMDDVFKPKSSSRPWRMNSI